MFTAKLHLIAFVTMLIMASIPTNSSAQDDVENPISPCDRAEARQFDFWIGEWNLTWGDTGRGTNIITSEMSRCVIEENFTTHDSKPFIGHSVSVYNHKIGKWQQTWVDNSGNYMDFLGEFKDGKMILSRQAERQGKKILQRMVFSNIQKDNLDWSWESSEDNGKTWKPLWEIRYQRKGTAKTE